MSGNTILVNLQALLYFWNKPDSSLGTAKLFGETFAKFTLLQ